MYNHKDHLITLQSRVSQAKTWKSGQSRLKLTHNHQA
uniref:Uncharacterized protein n=1 Tax=Arundo donax TaxID=35708 RepID=A0A0A9CYD0_ARUDO